MKIVGKSDIGKVRAKNEDQYAIIREKDGVFVLVCDGIGGHAAGEKASHLVAKHFKTNFKKHMPFTHVNHVKEHVEMLVQQANDLLIKQAQTHKNQQGMGTTFVGLYVSKEFTVLVNAGDSRCYGFKDDRLTLLSEDHSYVNQLVKLGRITKTQAKVHPYRNMLTNALGIAKKIVVDVVEIKEAYDFYLLSSDGLHGYVKDHEIETVLSAPMSITRKINQLIQRANDVGGFDNITVVLMALGGDHRA